MRSTARTWRASSFALAAVLLFAACTKNTPAEPTSTATAGASGPTATVTLTPIPTATPETGTGMIDVAENPDLGPIVVDPRGFTLYSLTKERRRPLHIFCRGACTKVFVPMLAPGGEIPPVAKRVRRLYKVSTTERSDGGLQVTFNGQPVYTFSLDTAPGQANGDGFSGVWWAVPGVPSVSGQAPT